MVANKEWLIDKYGTFKMGDREYYLEDGDTWVDTKSGEVYRGKGFDTAEIFHEEGEGTKPGTARGYQQTQIISDVIRDQGFSEQEEEGSGFYGRTLGVPYNPETETSLSRKLYQEGLVDLNSYTGKGDQEAYWAGKMMRGLLGEGDQYWDRARAELDEGSASDIYIPKREAIDEAQLAESPWLYNDVMFRHQGRNIKNEANSAFATGWDAGWNNIYGSLHGFKAALGDAIGNEEMFQNGTMGVEEYEHKNSLLPTYANDVGSIENITQAGRYMAGMMGQALPYIMGIAGSAAAGSFIAGSSALGLAIGTMPPALTYAGEVYGSMEGDMDERNAAAALSAGIVMGVLDRVGLHALLNTSSILKKDAMEKIAIELQKKKGLSSAAAKAKIKEATFSVEKEVADAAGAIAHIEMSKALLVREFGSSFLRGAGSEGITEGLQESTSYATSIAGSKREWNDEDYKRILMNAIAGGALLGGTLSGTMTTGKGYGSFKTMQRKYSQASTDVARNFFGEGNNIEQYEAWINHLEIESKDDLRNTFNNIFNTSIEDEKYSEAIRDFKQWRRESDKGELGGPMHKKYSHLNEELKKLYKKIKDPEADIIKRSKEDEAEGRKADTIKEKGVLRTLAELPGKAVQKGGSRLLEKFMDSPDVSDAAKHKLAIIMDTFAPSNTSHMAGMAAYKYKTLLMHTLLNHADMVKSEFIRVFDTKKAGQDYNAKMREFEAWQKETDEGQTNGPMHQKYRYIEQDLNKLHERIESSTNALWAAHNNLVEEVRDPLKGYFYKSSVLNPEAVRKNKELFIQTLVTGWHSPAEGNKPPDLRRMKRKEAIQLWNDIVNTPEGYAHDNTKDIAFKHRKAGTLRKTELYLRDSQVMNEVFLEKDNFEKLKLNITSEINHDMDLKTLGKDGINLDRALLDLKKEMGDTWDPRINALVKDSVAASRGDYKPISNKFLAKVQGHLTFIGTITQLDTSVLASLPEIGLLLLNAPKHGGVVGLIKNASRDLKKHYERSLIETAQNVKSGLGIDMDEYTQNQLDFYNFGYDSIKHGVMGHMDIGQEIDHMSKFKKNMLQAFFTLNLLKPYTDGSRVAKLSMAQDAIVDDLEIVSMYLAGGSNYAADAYERLRELNIDPIKLAKEYRDAIKILRADPTMIDRDVMYNKIANDERFANLLEQLQIARNSYVDNALANPNAIDRPLWYSNPHFRLMTQYKGFLSTFTSHILPRIYRQVKHGNPEARYQAVAMAATMIMFGFLGQDLKDEWKYKDGYNPWLDDAGEMQRGLVSSGLLGTPGELVNIIHPIYDFNRDAVDFANEFAGPFTGTLANSAKLIESVIGGDGARAAYYGKKFTPLVGRWKGFNERGGSSEIGF